MLGKEATTTSFVASLTKSVFLKHSSQNPQKIEETLDNAREYLCRTSKLIENYFPTVFTVPEYKLYNKEIEEIWNPISKLGTALTTSPSTAGSNKALREAKEYERKSLELLAAIRPRTENATKAVYAPNDTPHIYFGCPPKHVRDALAAWVDPAPKQSTIMAAVTQPELPNPNNDDDVELPPMSTISPSNDSLFAIGCPPKCVRDAVDKYKGPLSKRDYYNKLLKRLGLPIWDEAVSQSTSSKSERGSVKFPGLFGDSSTTLVPSAGLGRPRASSL